MHSSHVFEPIYTVENLYNKFIILQDYFLREDDVVFLLFLLFFCGGEGVEFGIIYNQSNVQVTRVDPPGIYQYAKMHVI